MERTKERSSFRKKFIGDRKFYMMVLAVAVPIMIQNGITNFDRADRYGADVGGFHCESVDFCL